MSRLAQTSFPDGGQTTITRQDTGTIWVKATQKINSSQNLIATSIFDAYGRVTQSQLNSDPQGADLVDTSYDPQSRLSTTSTPYRTGSEPTYGVSTISTYDGMDRATVVIDPDSSVAKTYYGAAVSGVTGYAATQVCTSAPKGYPVIGIDEAGKETPNLDRRLWQDVIEDGRTRFERKPQPGYVQYLRSE